VTDLVLASQSPRRRELFRLLGLEFHAISTDIDESQYFGEQPEPFVRRLSREKAHAALHLLPDMPPLILAADTIVVAGSVVLGKPADAAEARMILNLLRGQRHDVITALTLLEPATGRELTHVVRTPVMMRSYTDAEIEAYIETGDPYDKAGAYAIQHSGFNPAEPLNHCYANVMGLPLCHLHLMLQAFGVPSAQGIALRCRMHLTYPCPIADTVLAGQEQPLPPLA